MSCSWLPEIHGMWLITHDECKGQTKDKPSASASLKGTSFVLDINKEVSWNVPNHVETVSLFTTENYDMDRNTISFILPCGYLKFSIKVVEENMTLDYQGKLVLHCTKIHVEDIPMLEFSMLQVLESSIFTDICFTSNTGRQFQAHKCILHAIYPSIDWNRETNPLSNQPGNIIESILFYTYCGSLSHKETNNSIMELELFTTMNEGFDVLQRDVLNWIGVDSVRFRIKSLVEHFHDCTIKLNASISGGSYIKIPGVKTHLANPSTLMALLKKAFKLVIIAIAGQLLLAYTYTTREKELKKADKKEILKVIENGTKGYLKSIQMLLETLQMHLLTLSAQDIEDICRYTQDGVDRYLERFAKLLEKLKEIMERIQHNTNKEHKKSNTKKGMSISRIMKNALHITELYKLKKMDEIITREFVLVTQLSEQLREYSGPERIVYQTKFVNQLIKNLIPVYLKRLKKVQKYSSSKENYQRQKFKMLFKGSTSYFTWLLSKIHDNIGLSVPFIRELKEIVDEEEFDVMLQQLNLSSTTPSEVNFKQDEVSKKLPISILPNRIRRLYESEEYADLEFVVENKTDENMDGSSRIQPQRESILAHRVVLACRCRWFSIALSSGMKESLDRKFYIQDCSPHLFKYLLKFLYSEQVDLTELSLDDKIDLMVLSDRFEVDGLKVICQNELIINHISNDSVLCLLAVAENMSATMLKKACLCHISYSPNVCESNDFEKLPTQLQIDVKNQIRRIQSARKPSKDDFAGGFIWRSKGNSKNPSCDVSSDSDEFSLDDDSSSLAETSYNGDTVDTTELEDCVIALRNVLGDQISNVNLVRLALAADNDTTRALNFYYEGRFDLSG